MDGYSWLLAKSDRVAVQVGTRRYSKLCPNRCCRRPDSATPRGHPASRPGVQRTGCFLLNIEYDYRIGGREAGWCSTMFPSLPHCSAQSQLTAHQPSIPIPTPHVLKFDTLDMAQSDDEQQCSAKEANTVDRLLG